MLKIYMYTIICIIIMYAIIYNYVHKYRVMLFYNIDVNTKLNYVIYYLTIRFVIKIIFNMTLSRLGSGGLEIRCKMDVIVRI